MNKVDKQFENWIKNVKESDLLEDLKNISNNEIEKHDRFCKDISFGTAGLRGIMSAGTNRMNVYTVRRACQGLANYLNKNYSSPSAAVSFDSRNNSWLFACETAKVLSANGIKVYITKKLAPTPFLSFLVRHYKASAGVMITASHNTAEYNGYKCYGPDGAQLDEIGAEKIFDEISKVDIFKDVQVTDFDIQLENKMISFVSEAAYNEYFKCVLEQRINKVDLNSLKIVYTPLCGTGNLFVKEAFKRAGVCNLVIEPTQEHPDGNFTTCPSPNPEIKQAFDKALTLAKSENADIVIATDPDADRLGVCVKHDGDYRLLTGNEIGIILLNYILKNKKSLNCVGLPVVVKSVVSTMAANAIAEKYNCEVREVLTGFKNIAREILSLEEKNELDRYIFGFEESNGYLAGPYVRDKDAISASLLIYEAAVWWKNNFNSSLIDVLSDIYNEVGYYKEKTMGFLLNGDTIKKIMHYLRCDLLSGNVKNIVLVKDYLSAEVTDLISKKTTHQDLPKSNIISAQFSDGTQIIVRPSGTEPKIKFYIMVKSNSISQAENLLESYNGLVNKFVESFKN